MTENNTIYTSSGRCPKCGLPYMYIGDPINDITGVICTCSLHKDDVTYKFTPAPFPPVTRTEEYLERIAESLEVIARLLETGNAKIRTI